MYLKRLYRRKKLFVCFVALLVVITLSLSFTYRLRRVVLAKIDMKYTYIMFEEDLKNSVTMRKGEGCVMPQLDPFDAEVMEFEQSLPNVTCSGNDWMECFLDECFIANKIRKAFKDLSCVYRDIVYVNDLKRYLGPPTNLSAEQKYTLTKSDHVKVSCIGTFRQRPGPPLYWSGYKAGLRRVTPHQQSSCGPRLNVLMLCLDSTSKNGFIRKMPKSYVALKEIEAIILDGYNIVADGSSAALFPILTGKTVIELPEIRKGFTNNFIDEKSFIFSSLSKMGYRTAYFEAPPFLGVFQDEFNGFQHQPTDHYLLPVLQEFGSNSTRFCIGDVPLYRMLLNVTHQFYQLNGNRFSFTFISDTGRENYNMGSAVDNDLAFFLRRIQQGGKLKETVLFVMGNHGPRASSVREIQGKHEERLPLMAIVVPDSLKQSRPDAVAAMRANVEVLTTPFDIHSTLTDILGIGEQRNRYKVPGADMERGLTLLQPAGVLPHWCACAAWHLLSPWDHMFKEIGNMVADYINNLTKELRHLCLGRRLVSIEHVLCQTPTNKFLKYTKRMDFNGYLESISQEDRNKTISNYYQAKIIMSPARAVYEVSLRYFIKEDFFAISEHDISRVNAYANESACIRNKSPHLSKYCYCRSKKEFKEM